MDPATFTLLATVCAPMVDIGTARALVQVESGFHPHAIGVVGGQLVHQPRGGSEAIATAQQLRAAGWNFSVGLAQINVRNFARLGLDLRTAFDPCANLRAMQSVLIDCFERASATEGSAQRALRKALSCYYSGNFTTGLEHGYSRRVVRAATTRPSRSALPSSIKESA